MNTAHLFGRLTREVDYRIAQNGTGIARFTVAIDRPLSKEKKAQAEAINQPTADFISCLSFGKQAELIANSFNKGSQISISGRIQTGSYEKDGQRVYTTEVLVSEFDFVDGNKQDNRQPQGNFNQPQGFQQQNRFQQPQGNFNQPQQPQQQKQDNIDGFFPIDNENIPF